MTQRKKEIMFFAKPATEVDICLIFQKLPDQNWLLSHGDFNDLINYHRQNTISFAQKLEHLKRLVSGMDHTEDKTPACSLFVGLIKDFLAKHPDVDHYVTNINNDSNQFEDGESSLQSYR